MDPELRAFLEAMEQRAVDRDAETRAVLEAKIEAAREEAGAGLATLDAKIDAVATENRALHEHTWEQIKAMGEALSTDQREETSRIVADRERALMDQHILPPRASAANHEKRMKAVEGR